MAKPIKETPVLLGKDALRFLREVEANAKRDHSASFERAKAAYDRFQAKTHLTANVQFTSQ